MQITVLVLLSAVILIFTFIWITFVAWKKYRDTGRSNPEEDGSSQVKEIEEAKLSPMDVRTQETAPLTYERLTGMGNTETPVVQDILDVNILQQVIDVFTRATGLASVVADINGTPVTSLDHFSDFCMKHTRGTKEGSKRCEANDAKGGAEATLTGKPVVYYCHAGLIDFAVPLLVNGRQIGTWLGGQVLPAKPDEKKFRKIAREIGVDEEEYIRDLRKIKVIPKVQIDALAELLSLIANTLLQIAHARKVTEKKASELSDLVIHAVNELIDGIQGVSAPAKRLENMMTEAASALHQTVIRANSGQTELARMETTMQGMEEASSIISGKLVEINRKNQNISGIVGVITKISDHTNLLSLNAAVQAEKAGEFGRGFNVVAREIGRLADQTAVSTVGIESKVKEMQTVVSSGVQEMDRFIAEVRRTANDAVSISEQLTQIIQQVRVLLPQFEEIKAEINGQTERTGELHRSMSSLSEDMQKAIDVVRGSFRVIERSKGNKPGSR